MSDIEVTQPAEEEFKAPRKPLKRKISETDKMETESVESSGIDSSVSETLPKVGRRRIERQINNFLNHFPLRPRLHFLQSNGRSLLTAAR